jgi:hypothetical protein
MKSRVRVDRLLLVVVAAAAVAVLVGCGEDGSDDEAATTTSSAAPAQTGSGALIGNYMTTLGPSGPELKEPNPPGKWQLQITSATEVYYQPPRGASFPVGNPTELSSERIVFAPDLECPTQEGTPGKGTYEWHLSGETLTFTEVEDTCRDRAFVLTSNPWSKTQ